MRILLTITPIYDRFLYLSQPKTTIYNGILQSIQINSYRYSRAIVKYSVLSMISDQCHNWCIKTIDLVFD